MQNPLEAYRRAQRVLRRDFNAFTSVHCATCDTPCCVRPARIVPTDILLAEGMGWKATVQAVADRDAVQRAAGATAAALNGVDEDSERQSCEYLGEHGCTFPNDLRPYGCTAYICRPMYEKLDRKTLDRMKRSVRELDRCHHELMKYLHRSHGVHEEEGDD